MSAAVILALHLIVLHGPDGQLIELNPEQVISLRTPRGTEHVHAGVKCLVFTSDGKYTGVVEDCETVNEKLTDVEQ